MAVPAKLTKKIELPEAAACAWAAQRVSSSLTEARVYAALPSKLESLVSLEWTPEHLDEIEKHCGIDVSKLKERVKTIRERIRFGDFGSAVSMSIEVQRELSEKLLRLGHSFIFE
jgi:hypothetical protein